MPASRTGRLSRRRTDTIRLGWFGELATTSLDERDEARQGQSLSCQAEREGGRLERLTHEPSCEKDVRCFGEARHAVRIRRQGALLVAQRTVEISLEGVDARQQVELRC